MKHLLHVCIISYVVSTTNIHSLPDVSPETIEFAWDMHNTLMHKYVPQNVMYLTPAQQLLLKKINKFFRQTQNNEQLQEYKKVIEQTNPGLWQIAEQLSGYHYPRNGVFSLIQELNKLGYKQRLASNISALELVRLKKQFPAIFAILHGEQTVIFDGSKPRIKKPNPLYFRHFQNTFNPDRKKTIIFIDEKPKNTRSATKEGLLGITFKNTEQLRNELKKLGIPLQ